MTTITTVFLGPTNYRGSRLLIRRLGWFHEPNRGDKYGKWYAGGTRRGYVFVCAVEYAELKPEP